MYRSVHHVMRQLALGLSIIGSVYLLSGCATLSKQVRSVTGKPLATTMASQVTTQTVWPLITKLVPKPALPLIIRHGSMVVRVGLSSTVLLIMLITLAGVAVS
nr:hypothetical protein [Psychrobacter sp. NG27]